MKRNALGALIFFLPLLLASCAAYTKVEGGNYTASENFTIELPPGWRKHNIHGESHPLGRKIIETLEERRKLEWDAIRITRDGLLLQQISIGRIPIDEELPHTKKKLSEGMLNQEVADVIVDNLRSNPNITNQEILENIPEYVGGHSGFKLHYSYRTEDGLKIEGIYYGTMVDSWLYYLLYEAPTQHYFAKDRPVLERMKDTLKITGEVA